jgi:hypothetical protein
MDEAMVQVANKWLEANLTPKQVFLFFIAFFFFSFFLLVFFGFFIAFFLLLSFYHFTYHLSITDSNYCYASQRGNAPFCEPHATFRTRSCCRSNITCIFFILIRILSYIFPSDVVAIVVQRERKE